MESRCNINKINDIQKSFIPSSKFNLIINKLDSMNENFNQNNNNNLYKENNKLSNINEKNKINKAFNTEEIKEENGLNINNKLIIIDHPSEFIIKSLPKKENNDIYVYNNNQNNYNNPNIITKYNDINNNIPKNKQKKKKRYILGCLPACF